jgi:hypothetical protein
MGSGVKKWNPKKILFRADTFADLMFEGISTWKFDGNNSSDIGYTGVFPKNM